MLSNWFAMDTDSGTRINVKLLLIAATETKLWLIFWLHLDLSEKNNIQPTWKICAGDLTTPSRNIRHKLTKKAWQILFLGNAIKRFLKLNNVSKNHLAI